VIYTSNRGANPAHLHVFYAVLLHGNFGASVCTSIDPSVNSHGQQAQISVIDMPDYGPQDHYNAARGSDNQCLPSIHNELTPALSYPCISRVCIAYLFSTQVQRNIGNAHHFHVLLGQDPRGDSIYNDSWTSRNPQLKLHQIVHPLPPCCRESFQVQYAPFAGSI